MKDYSIAVMDVTKEVKPKARTGCGSAVFGKEEGEIMKGNFPKITLLERLLSDERKARNLLKVLMTLNLVVSIDRSSEEFSIVKK